MKRLIWIGIIAFFCLQGMAQTTNKTVAVKKPTTTKQTVKKPVATKTTTTSKTATAKPTTTKPTTAQTAGNGKTDKTAFNEKVYELYRYNSQGEVQLEKATSIKEAMQRFPYDVVVWQQYSLESGDYTTYEPYLSKLIQAYNITKLAARTTFAFNETWAYASNAKNLTRYKNQKNMWKSICTAVRKMKAASGIDLVIPCGTAVQNAREVEALKVDNELTRDGTHINYFAGRYLLACTFFESIIAPCLNRNLRDDTTIYGKESDTGQVNNTNRRLLQNCARLAVANNYEISEFAGQ